MDSYVTYLQITSAESGRASLLQLPPSPHVSSFSLYGCCLLQMQVWGGSAFILGGACRPLPGGRPACRPSTGRYGPPCDRTQILITYRYLPPGWGGGRGPAAPQTSGRPSAAPCRAVGV